MDTKKIMIFSIIGFIISLLIFGATLYFVYFKNSDGSRQNLEAFNYDAGQFSTNMGDSNHYFKGNIVIESTDEKEIEVMTEKSVIIRDTILKVIISQDPEKMTSNEGLDKLERELISDLSTKLNLKSIKNVYFTDYIVQ
ncbi:MAG: flagellar basal body-associated FliL family protein [Tepidibacter sp.]|jgi:flagellar FliL protein|uniref:flagellar basal body-associated FliL family protein n=1 Tax=Tepidibacter sp. TaxID=2529387 RepID=UPI0025DC2E3B|nr:flagellar basal body-associated FliL family protein [Tepidibacter sp.]MCT4507991.1 flagellar basal body-associated FliL family protein [Tepidibacter sp.]